MIPPTPAQILAKVSYDSTPTNVSRVFKKRKRKKTTKHENKQGARDGRKVPVYRQSG